jgi:hypothetical protein
MWKTLCQSVPGTSHRRQQKPCQDYGTACSVPLPHERVLILACSDGAGSAEYSQLGARLACEAAVRTIAAALQATGGLPVTRTLEAAAWVRPVHEALAAAAAARQIDLRQMACTLLFAVLGERGAAFGQIGDGAIVAQLGGRFEHMHWPQAGQYFNTTFFVTDPNFEAHLECLWCSQPVDEVALFTDGLQSLALDFAARQAHGAFFAPMFAALRREPAFESLLAPLAAFLDSPAVTQRTDDDKTLILATRIPC